MDVGEHDDGVADPHLGMADLPGRRVCRNSSTAPNAFV